MVEQRFHLYESCLDKTQAMTDSLRTVFLVGATAGKGVEIDLLNMYLASFIRRLARYSDSDIASARFSLPAFRGRDLPKNG